MTLTLSAAHRASLRRIVENAGSSAYSAHPSDGKYGIDRSRRARLGKTEMRFRAAGDLR
jgi:hypothetical protein